MVRTPGVIGRKVDPMTDPQDSRAPSAGALLRLPDRPDLEHLKHQAKRRLGELRAAEPAAKLADAQYAVARDYGFDSWRALKAFIDAKRDDAPPDRAGEASAAAQRGDTEVLRAMLDQYPMLLRMSMKPFGMQMIHQAAYHGHRSVVELLIERWADIHAKSEGDTAYPLHFAAEMGHLDIVKLLVEAGSDIHWGQTEHKLDVLGWATCFAEVREDVADYLLERGARWSIFPAVAMGRIDEVARLLDADATLIEKPMSVFEQHRRPLHLAVLKGRSAVVRLLLARGAQVHAKDKLGLTPLGLVGAKTDPAITAVLLDAGAELDLLSALITGHADRAEELLALRPDRLGPGGPDAGLIVIAAQRGATDAVRWLLDHGADVNAQASVYDMQVTALHQAAANGDLPLIQLLLDAGADVTIKDDTHDSPPAGWARHFGHDAAAELLESSGPG